MKYDHGGLWPLPSQQQHQQDADKEMQNSDDSHPIDLMTPIIFRVCFVMYNHLTPLARVRLSNNTQLKQQPCTDHCISRGTGSNQHNLTK